MCVCVNYILPCVVLYCCRLCFRLCGRSCEVTYTGMLSVTERCFNGRYFRESLYVRPRACVRFIVALQAPPPFLYILLAAIKKKSTFRIDLPYFNTLGLLLMQDL